MSPHPPRQPSHPGPVDATLAGRTVRVERANADSPHEQVTAPLRPPAPRRVPYRRRSAHKPRWLALALLTIIGALALTVMGALALLAGAGLVYSGGILPGVSAGGVNLGGLNRDEAAARLAAHWMTVTLADNSQQPARTWTVERTALGIDLDVAATVDRAYDQGRGQRSILTALLRPVDVAPVVRIDTAVLSDALEALRPQTDMAPVDVGVRLVNGEVQPVPPRLGYALDVAATVARLRQDAAQGMVDESFELVMTPVQPAYTDSTPLLPLAALLLANPLTMRVYDPVTGDIVDWSQPPEVWADWMVMRNNGFTVRADIVRDYLQRQAQVFDASRYLDLDSATQAVQESVEAGSTRTTLRVYHRDRQHVVQPGETIGSIAWDYGVPYPWIQQANAGVVALSAGQTITIPSPDNFLPFPVIADKRIVVSISQQRTRLYENDQLIHDWPASTGISDSPTWPGIYQVISHEMNAYAGNWDLWMPYFVGVYQPIPGANFTNGFHGFPTRGGGQILWENSLGRRVTYGCILLSNSSAQFLYEWAQTGVVVEIQP